MPFGASETNLWHPDWESMPDNLLKAGISFVVVFLGLLLLIGLIYLFQLVFKYRLIERCGAFFKREKPETEFILQSGKSEQEGGAEDEETAAAITAAVYALMETESGSGPVAPFTIRSIKRK